MQYVYEIHKLQLIYIHFWLDFQDLLKTQLDLK